YDEGHVGAPSEIAAWRRPGRVLWLDVVGLGDAELVLELGSLFALHSLALEDAVNVHQRPKAEDYGDSVYVVLRMPSLVGSLDLEQVSFFLGTDFVITLQQHAGDLFGPVRERIRHDKGRVRQHGADYLAYALIDAIVDHYFPILEQYGERLDTLEERILARPEPASVSEVHAIRHELYALRRALWPTRDALAELGRTEATAISHETQLFLRDCHDHAVQLIDMVEACRELAASLMDLYLSGLSQRMNEVMKVLTLIATIFMPLAFVAGLYGMNFDPAASPWNMPELRWPFGYAFALALMASIAGGMLGYFRRKGWLGDRVSRESSDDLIAGRTHDDAQH
ncbi:MAG: magnesium/cobalt transporter CorA, partial [Myxococcota bacterium]